MTIEYRCKKLQEELSHYHTSKELLIAEKIKERLDASFNSYEKGLDDSLGYLIRRNGVRVLKKINKL